MAALEYVSPRYLSAAETAKLIRPALKQRFPGVKFSVRSSTYSGGASIDVSWTDGPTSREVEQITNRFRGADFDGMIDLKTYNESWIEQDGTVHLAHARGTESSRGYLPEIVEDPMTPGAQLVRFGSDHVFAHRDISPEWTRQIVALFEQVTGHTLGSEADDRWGFWRQQVPLSVDRLDGRLYHMVETDRDDLSSIFHQFTGWRQGGSLDIFGGGAES